MATVTTTKAAKAGMWTKAVALLAWGIGVWTTHMFLQVLIITPEGQPVEWTLFAAILLQLILTAGESPLWRGQGQWWHVLILVADTVTNVGGFFSYMLRLDQTDSWAAFNAGLGTTGGLNPLAALVLSLGLGILTAAAPEFLWRQR
jgi:hypothetical protein